MMTRRTITAVSYLNTIPFIYGIEHAGDLLRADLLLSPPSLCAENIALHKADIGLIPVQALAAIPELDIITDYCIGASGPVRTVVLASNHPVEEVDTVYLDSHSLTSVKLSRILAAEKWGITPRWQPLDGYDILSDPPSRSAFVLIGDKVFTHENDFSHRYDLAVEWQVLTDLPFVFAVWVATRGKVPSAEVETLNRALGYGTAHIDEAVVRYGYDDRPYARDYLTKNIDFNFDAPKREALELFLRKGATV